MGAHVARDAAGGVGGAGTAGKGTSVLESCARDRKPTKIDGHLNQALHEALLNAPYEAFANIVAAKLASQGVTLTSRERRRLVEHLKSNAVESFQFRNWRWWEKRSIKIEVTAEIEALHASFTEFLENHLPQLIESTADDLSASILKTLNRTWLAQDRADRHDIRGFQRRLLKHWG
jgi:hypothetical protein